MTKEELHKIDTHIGQKLRYFRVLRGYTQDHLASLTGVTFQQIQKYEYGSNRISASRMVQIAQTLQINPACFFEGLEIPITALPPVSDQTLNQHSMMVLQEYRDTLERAQSALATLMAGLTPRADEEAPEKMN